MLVLTRKIAETIHIGNGIVVKVISCGRGRVKIGIEAPTDVRVIRGELADSALLSRLKLSHTSLPAPSAHPVA
jgi:carbon storage regulator